MENSKKLPLITVGMPMYNASRHLRECIDSILRQTYPYFELLIIDDGSTDESVAIVQSYKDERIRLISSEHHYINTINLLLDEAKGCYFARMDADDLMVPNRIAIQLEYMEKHPDVDIMGGLMHLTGDIHEKYNDSTDCYAVTLDRMTEGTILAHPTIMMRLASIRAKKLHYREDYIYAEDYDFWVQALCAGLKIQNMCYHFIYYRISKEQVSCKYNQVQKNNARRIEQRVHTILYGDHLKRLEENANSFRQLIKEPLEGNKLTIVMPFLNEGEEVANTLNSIRQTIGNQVEIIVINDGSDDNFDYAASVAPYHVSYLVQKERKGVAANRDLGVYLCRTPYVLLLDAHMRFYDSYWAKRLIGLLEENERVLLCAQSRYLSKDETGQVIHNKEYPQGFGAKACFSPSNYWPDIEWNLGENLPNEKLEPIAFVLGAGYAFSKKYWQKLKGLQGLLKYGCDEALISTKVWREGGKCLLVKDVEIGHIYRTTFPYRNQIAEEISNYLLTTYLTFSQSWHCMASAIALRIDKELYRQALIILETNRTDWKALKEYMDSIYTVSFETVMEQHRAIWLRSNPLALSCGRAHEVNDFMLQHRPLRIGLYEGKMGWLLWLCHYSRSMKTQQYNALIQSIWNDCIDAVEDAILPYNFAQGLCGIGWAFIYLQKRGFTDDYPHSILNNIDHQLEYINPRTLPKKNIGHGVGGLLAYATIRKLTGNPAWKSNFDEELLQCAREIAEDGKADLPSLYYALFFLSIDQNGVSSDEYVPHINEWMICKPILPSNSKYWKPALYNGCMGALINLISHSSATNIK